MKRDRVNQITRTMPPPSLFSSLMTGRPLALRTAHATLTGLLVFAWSFALCPPAEAQSPVWKTGANFNRRLAQAESVYWTDVELKQALMRLSQNTGVAILLDRRIDPNRHVDFSATNESLRDLLKRFASENELGSSRIGDVVYIGPPTTAARLRTVLAAKREEIEKLSPALQEKLQAPRPLSWDDFAEPGDIATELGEQAEMQKTHADRLPHDLMAAVSLPRLSLSDRLTLLAAQFGKMYVLSPDGRQLSFVSIPEDIAIVRPFPLQSDPQGQIARWKQVAPDAEFKVHQGQLFVRGRVEDMDAITNIGRATTGSRPSNQANALPPIESQRFTATVQNKPLEAVLQGFAQQLQLNVQIDWDACRRAGVEKDTLISFESKDANIDGLFRLILRETGLRFQRQGRTVRIGP